jgi:hypothetical protein
LTGYLLPDITVKEKLRKLVAKNGPVCVPANTQELLLTLWVQSKGRFEWIALAYITPLIQVDTIEQVMEVEQESAGDECAFSS